jgi:hypothetical protein
MSPGWAQGVSLVPSNSPHKDVCCHGFSIHYCLRIVSHCTLPPAGTSCETQNFLSFPGELFGLYRK